MPSTINPRRLRWTQIGSSTDFSAGPNIRDAPTELSPNESTDAWNVTFDERGGVSSRLGHAKYNGSVYGGGLVQNEYYSNVAAALITQAGASLYKGTSTSANKTFSTSARVGMVDFGTTLCVIHPVDGVWTSTDGVTYTHVVDVDAPLGDVLETWQNKLYAAGNPAFPARVSWSAPGDPTSWVATDFNELRTKDNTKVVALKAVPGLDIVGRAGLFAAKNESTYRIYDSTTGAYEMLDATNGCASSLSIISIGAKVICLNKHGIYWWQNGLVGMTNASDRLKPLWDPGQINLGQLPLFCAGRSRNRVLFSLCRAGSTANDLAIEYHPDEGWVAPRSDAMSCYATSSGSDEVVYGGSPTATGQTYVMNSGGTDDGTAIPWRFQTRWFDLAGGFHTSVWQVRVHGRGTGKMTTLKDYSTSGGDQRTFNLVGPALPLWDSGLHWDTGVLWGTSQLQTIGHFYSIGSCKQMAFKFEGTSSTTVQGLPVLGGAAGTTVGSFGLFGLEFLYFWLGFDS